MGGVLQGLAPTTQGEGHGLADPLLHALGFGAWAAAVTTALRRANRRGKPSRTRPSRSDLQGARAAVGATLVIAFGALLRALSPAGDPGADANLVRMLEEAPGVWVALALVIAPALCEEALFRGAALRWSAERAGWPTALFVSAGAFAALHPAHPIQAGLFGLALAALALATGRLREAVMAHAVHNAIGLWLVGGITAAPACAIGVGVVLSWAVGDAGMRALRARSIAHSPSG